MIFNKVKNYIKSRNMILPDDTVIIGLSGGADSVCLLLILLRLQKEMPFKIAAVHVHHQIRPVDADADEAFVTELCRKNHVELFKYKRNIPLLSKQSGETEEECGRRIRYELLRETALKYDRAKIAVAHHMDDQAETVLFRMARGTGLKGIAGMRSQNDDIIRPLLCIDKADILNYLKEIGQDYCTDETNHDDSYSRNDIRLNIIPRLNNINSQAVRHICTLAEETQQLMDYVDSLANQVLEKARSNEEGKVSVSELPKDDGILLSYIIRKILSDEGISLKDIHREHIEAIKGILDNTESSSIDLPGNISVIVESGYIFLDKGRQSLDNDFIVKIDGEGDYELPDGSVLECRIITGFSKDDFPQNLYTKWFDYDKISNGLCIRKRQSHDFLVTGRHGETKKLKDYMINEKIPKSKRNDIMLLANNDRIAWVLGYRISEDVKVDKNTKKVMQISCKKKA